MTHEKTEMQTAPKRPAPKRAARPPRKTTSTGAAIKEAERALQARKVAHRAAFRATCVKVFNTFGFALVASGTEGSKLEIQDLTTTYGTPIEALLSDIPE